MSITWTDVIYRILKHRAAVVGQHRSATGACHSLRLLTGYQTWQVKTRLSVSSVLYETASIGRAGSALASKRTSHEMMTSDTLRKHGHVMRDYHYGECHFPLVKFIDIRKSESYRLKCSTHESYTV